MLAGYEPGDANWAPPLAEGTFLDAAKRDPGTLRVGFTMTPTVEGPIAQEHVDAVIETAEQFEAFGHEVVEAQIPWDNEDMLDLFMQKWGVGIASLTNFGAQVSGQDVTPETVEKLTYDFWQIGVESHTVDYGFIDTALKAFARRMVSSMLEFDAILCPVLNQRPVPIGSIDPDDGIEAFEKAVDFTSFTAGVNLAGLPGISLPTSIADDGLPVAIQLIGSPAGEATMLSLAAQLEANSPWADWRP